MKLTPIQQKLLQDLKHSDEDMRTLSAMTLMKITIEREYADPFITALKEATRDKVVAVRFFARKALHRFLSQDTPVDVENSSDLDLVELLRSPRQKDQVESAKELGKRGKKQALEPLSRQLRRETDPHVRSTLITALGKLGSTKEIEILRPYLQDGDPRVRANTIEALGLLSPTNSDLSFLVVMLQDEDNRVQATTAMMLAKFGEEKVLKTLDKMLFSGEQWLFQSALHALEFIVLEGVDKLAIRFLKQAEGETLFKCLRVISQFTTDEAIQCLKSQSTNENKKVAEAARKLLETAQKRRSEKTLSEVNSGSLDQLVATGKIVKISPTGFIRFKAPDQQTRYEAHLSEVGKYLFGLFQEGEIKDPELQHIGSQIMKFEFIYTQKMEEYKKNREGNFGNFMKSLFSKEAREEDTNIKYTVDRKNRAIIDLGLKALEKFKNKALDFPLLGTYAKAIDRIIHEGDTPNSPNVSS